MSGGKGGGGGAALQGTHPLRDGDLQLRAVGLGCGQSLRAALPLQKLLGLSRTPVRSTLGSGHRLPLPRAPPATCTFHRGEKEGSQVRREGCGGRCPTCHASPPGAAAVRSGEGCTRPRLWAERSPVWWFLPGCNRTGTSVRRARRHLRRSRVRRASERRCDGLQGPANL